MPPCPRCTGVGVKQDGPAGETRRYRCQACRRTFIARMGTPFAGHRRPQEVVVTAVRWYLRYRLSAADVRVGRDVGVPPPRDRRARAGGGRAAAHASRPG